MRDSVVEGVQAVLMFEGMSLGVDGEGEFVVGVDVDVDGERRLYSNSLFVVATVNGFHQYPPCHSLIFSSLNPLNRPDLVNALSHAFSTY